MQAVELAKGARFALAVTVGVDSIGGFAEELRLVKGALLEWRAKRGGVCDLVMLTVVSAPEHHTDIEAQVEHVYRNEEDLAPLLQSVTFQVALLDTNGTPCKELTLGRPATAAPVPRSKPWWRFW